MKGCEGNCKPGGKLWQPTAGFMTYVTCRLTEPGSAPEPYARQSSMGYLYLFYYEVHEGAVESRNHL